MQFDWAIRKRLCEQHLKMLNDISAALGQKDSYTQAHGHRVAVYAMRLARHLRLPEDEVRYIGIGGLFHDVGKLALSDKIFTNGEAHLSNDLRQEVNCHPLIGAALLKDIDFLEPMVDFVLFHHEREDGGGYPFGLKKAEIPVGAKIISIADCFRCGDHRQALPKRAIHRIGLHHICVKDAAAISVSPTWSHL